MTLIELSQLYKNNNDFKTYVDKYAKTHRLLPENAMKCKVVNNYAEWLSHGKVGMRNETDN